MDDLLADLPTGSAVANPPVRLPSRPQAIEKLSYNHDAMVGMIIAEPWISQNELAKRFGMTASWISRIISSDAFQVKLAEQSDKLVDPAIKLSVQENFRGLMMRSIEVLNAKFDKPPEQIPDQLALQTFSLTSRAAGYGSRTEVKIEVGVSAHIEEHTSRLRGLLRKTKSELASGEIYDGEVEEHD